MSKQVSGMPKGQPLEPELQAELQEIVIRIGECHAVKQLGINRGTLMRALASFPLYDGTRFHIENQVKIWRAQHP